MRDKCEWPGVTPLTVFICTCFYCHTGPKLDLCVEHLSQHRLVAVDVEHVLNPSPACRCVRCVRRTYEGEATVASDKDNVRRVPLTVYGCSHPPPCTPVKMIVLYYEIQSSLSFDFCFSPLRVALMNRKRTINPYHLVNRRLDDRSRLREYYRC